MKKTTWLGGMLLVAVASLASAAGIDPSATSVCVEQAVYQSNALIQVLDGDDQNLYTGLYNGKVQRVSKSNWVVTDLTTAGGPIESVSLDSNNIYYAFSIVANNAKHHQIFSIPKAGGTPQLVADTTDVVGKMKNDDSYLYFLSPSSVTTAADGKLERVRKSGGSVESLVSGLSIPIDLALDSTNVYYTEEGVNRIPPYGLSRIAKTGGTPTRLTSFKPGEAIAGISGSTIFFQAREDDLNHGLYTMPVTGGAPTPLHTPLFAPSRIVRMNDGRLIYSVGYNDWTYGTVGSLTVFDTAGNPIVIGKLPIRNFSADSTAVYAAIGVTSSGLIDRYCLNYATAPRITTVVGSSATTGGSHITIEGQNFQAGARVTFGGVDGTVQSVTPTAIQVTTPPHVTGNVDVYVINPNGESGRGTIFYDPRLNPPASRKRAVAHPS
jgi:hypothetical protein